MMMEQIEKDLRTWFEAISKKFPWLTIKYEFSQKRNLWLVSFSPVSQIELSDDFNKEAMAFEDEMNAKYGYMAPLFTDEESLFRLSPVAKTFGLKSLDCYKTSILSEKSKELAWSIPVFSVSSVSSMETRPFSNISNHKCSFVKVA